MSRHINDLEYEYYKTYLTTVGITLNPFADYNTLRKRWLEYRLEFGGGNVPTPPVPPYVPPTFTTDDPTNILISGTVINNATFSVGYARAVTAVMQMKESSVYVMQFDYSPNGNTTYHPLYFMAENPDNQPSTGDALIYNLSSGTTQMIVQLQGASSITNLAGVHSGTFVFDTLNKSFDVYDTFGGLIASRPWGSIGTGSFTNNDLFMRLNYNGYSTPQVTSFFTDKTTMPYDLTLSDLGVFLTANPTWKQLNE